LAIPNATWLRGVQVDAQAAVLDPGVNAASLVMSPGGTLQIGGR